MRFLVDGDLKPGANLVPLANIPELQYQNLYMGYDPLAESAADREGEPPLLFNFFKTVADYFHGEIVSGFDAEDVTPLEANQISLAVYYRIFYGYGILAYIGERFLAISPRYWWPLMSQGFTVGAVVVLPYATASLSGSIQGAGGLPNRALVSQIDSFGAGQSMVWDVDYNGIALGSDWRAYPEALTRFAVFGDGISDFPQMTSGVNALDTLLKGANTLLDRHAQPHLQVPAASVNYDDDGNPFLTVDSAGMIFPVNSDDKDVKYVSPAAAPDMWQLALDAQLRLLAGLTSVPFSVFGEFPLPRLQSESSIIAMEASTTKKVRALRNELEGAILSVGLNLPRVPELSREEGENEPAD